MIAGQFETFQYEIRGFELRKGDKPDPDYIWHGLEFRFGDVCDAARGAKLRFDDVCNVTRGAKLRFGDVFYIRKHHQNENLRQRR